MTLPVASRMAFDCLDLDCWNTMSPSCRPGVPTSDSTDDHKAEKSGGFGASLRLYCEQYMPSIQQPDGDWLNQEMIYVH